MTSANQFFTTFNLVAVRALLTGLNKTEFLRAYEADVFFDDQQTHCDLASPHVATGHVPHGVANS